MAGKGAGRHIGHKLRVGGDPGRYTAYSQVGRVGGGVWRQDYCSTGHVSLVMFLHVQSVATVFIFMKMCLQNTAPGSKKLDINYSDL